jgi:hypothetical protein
VTNLNAQYFGFPAVLSEYAQYKCPIPNSQYFGFPAVLSEYAQYKYLIPNNPK